MIDNFPDQDELLINVDHILFNVWDPMGINSNPDARDEYRSYAKTIAKMLRHGRDSYAIAAYLRDIEMGILAQPVNEPRLEKVIAMIFSSKNTDR